MDLVKSFPVPSRLLGVTVGIYLMMVIYTFTIL